MPEATSGRRRVLIAEDEPSILLSVEFLMREAGYEVHLATDGAQALEQARATRPDLLVLDIMLPRLDGFEVCRAIRADPALAQVRILMLTARGRDTEIRKGLELGANAYLTKPFATTDLVALVARLLAPEAA